MQWVANISVTISKGTKQLLILTTIAVFPLLVSCGGSFQIKNIYDQSSGPDDLDDLGFQLRSQRPEFVLRDSGNVSAILGKPRELNTGLLIGQY